MHNYLSDWTGLAIGISVVGIRLFPLRPLLQLGHDAHVRECHGHIIVFPPVAIAEVDRFPVCENLASLDENDDRAHSAYTPCFPLCTAVACAWYSMKTRSFSTAWQHFLHYFIPLALVLFNLLRITQLNQQRLEGLELTRQVAWPGLALFGILLWA